jgi:hypothetical protein
LIELDDTLLIAQQGFFFYQNNFMFHLVDNVVEALISAGIIQKLKEYHFWFTEGKEKPDEDEGPQVLRVCDLSFGFVIWLIACGISTFAFVIEWLIPRVTHWTRTTVGLVLFLNLLRSRLRQLY